VKNNKLIIFPNGYGMTTSSEILEQLRDAIIISLERTVKDDIKMYLSGKTQVVSKDETDNVEDDKNNKKSSIAKDEGK
jgi:sugar-specific transcriptional regulator TrmB